MINYDYEDIKESGDFSPAPKGQYLLRITGTEEKRTRKDDPMVNVQLVIAQGPHSGKKIWHTVCFLPKDSPGAGISKHWLHALGLPHEGKISINHKDWRQRLIVAELDTDTYEGKNGPRSKNIIVEVIISDNDESQISDAPDSSGVPF